MLVVLEPLLVMMIRGVHRDGDHGSTAVSLGDGGQNFMKYRGSDG